ncbi:MAG: hypothetical protein C4346_17155 [Chloroflexota bacterium]
MLKNELKHHGKFRTEQLCLVAYGRFTEIAEGVGTGTARASARCDSRRERRVVGARGERVVLAASRGAQERFKSCGFLRAPAPLLAWPMRFHYRVV